MNGPPLCSKLMAAVKTRDGFGGAASPAVYGDRLFIVNDNDEQSFIAAFNTVTGDEVWRVDRPAGTNWVTPFVWANERRTEIVTAGAKGVPSSGLDGTLLLGVSGVA